MSTKQKLRSSILNRIKHLPEDKLLNLDEYINDLEAHHDNESVLSFSGIFAELEMNDLTSKLHKNREDRIDRIPLF